MWADVNMGEREGTTLRALGWSVRYGDLQSILSFLRVVLRRDTQRSALKRSGSFNF